MDPAVAASGLPVMATHFLPWRIGRLLGVVPAPKPGRPWEDAENDHKRQKKKANFFICEKKEECEMNSNQASYSLDL